MIRARVIETATGCPTNESTSMHQRINTRAAELDTVVFKPEPGAPSKLVVMCHGFGAPGTDLVSLAPEMVALAPRLANTTFAFPAGPLDLSPLGLWGGRAWFPIDMQALQSGNTDQRIAQLASAEPPGMAAARKKLRAAIESLMGAQPWSEVVLGGFSQGAMMALDLALRLEEAPAAVIAFSPTLVDRANWQRLALQRKGLKVLISHGRQDPVLPIRGTEALVALLNEAGLAVEYVPFNGPHTIPYEALERAAATI